MNNTKWIKNFLLCRQFFSSNWIYVHPKGFVWYTFFTGFFQLSYFWRSKTKKSNWKKIEKSSLYQRKTLRVNINSVEIKSSLKNKITFNLFCVIQQKKQMLFHIFEKCFTFSMETKRKYYVIQNIFMINVK